MSIGFILAKVFAFFVFLLYEKLKDAILRFERETITKYSIWYQYETWEAMVFINEIALEPKIKSI